MNTQNQNVKVLEIKEVKRKNAADSKIFQLFLGVDIETMPENNPILFFLKGAISPQIEKRRAYQNISEVQIREYNIQVGTILNEAFQMPNLRLVVKESLEPRTWQDVNGVTQYSKPKINPSTKQVLTLDGAPIYRDTFLSLDGVNIIYNTKNPPKGILLDATDEFLRSNAIALEAPQEGVSKSLAEALEPAIPAI